MENRISAALDAAQKAVIHGHYTGLEKDMAFLLALDTSEKRAYLNLSDKQSAIGDQVLEWLKSNPTRFGETDKVELEKDLTLRTDLTAIKAMHDAIGERINSTITRASQEAMFELRLLKRDVDTAVQRDASLKPLKALLDGLFERSAGSNKSMPAV